MVNKPSVFESLKFYCTWKSSWNVNRNACGGSNCITTRHIISMNTQVNPLALSRGDDDCGFVYFRECNYEKQKNKHDYNDQCYQIHNQGPVVQSIVSSLRGQLLTSLSVLSLYNPIQWYFWLKKMKAHIFSIKKKKWHTVFQMLMFEILTKY